MLTRNQIKNQVQAASVPVSTKPKHQSQKAVSVSDHSKSKRQTQKPERFETLTFTKGSRCKGCDSWDRGYDGRPFPVLGNLEQILHTPSPNFYVKDDFLVSDSEAESSNYDSESESETEYSDSDSD